MKHLRSIEELGLKGLERILELTKHMAEINTRPVPKVPALRGRTVVSLFLEDSTRTRLSFETAARRLSADTLTFSVSTSSVNKGESLRDTVETISDMGVDAFVVRHKSAGVPWQMSAWTNASIVNAGDGAHQHPTQALVDCYTVREAFGRNRLDGLMLTIVGDIKHSRVARSNIQAFALLGADITLVAPKTLLPPDVEHWPVKVNYRLDDVIDSTDVLYMLRLQSERMSQGHVPTLREYGEQYGLTPRRVAHLAPTSVVMHPGPMNRGVEMQVDPQDLTNSLIHRQVANGVAVRMAVLFDVLAGEQSPSVSSLTSEVA
ncbi:MAG: aspartate carbamoyltransferase catalytic subunit [Ilumatobacteraceae bacterium]